MTTESLLGPMEKRQKTDLRLPTALTERMKQLADAIGVPANAVYAFAAARLVTELAHLGEPKAAKRDTMLREMESQFQKLLAEVRKNR